MENKGIIKKIALVFFGLWVLIGLLIPIRLMSLLRYVEEFQNGRLGPDQVIRPITNPPKFKIGVRFYHSGLLWLDGKESDLLTPNLLCGKLSYSFGETETKYGYLHVIPKWASNSVVRHVFHPFIYLTGIHFFYYPKENLLYLSEDRYELNYDYCRGLNVSNVPPSLLHYKVSDE